MPIKQLFEENEEEEVPEKLKIPDDQELETLILEETDEEDEATTEGFYDDAIKQYLHEIKKSKLLTAEEEKKLANRIERGDKSARARMIESNLRLVVKIAKRYVNRGLPFLDLIEEGNIGLIKAVQKFKISKECRFSTYATWWIRQSMERAMVNQSRTIRLPVHVSDDVNRMLKATSGLVVKLNREPTIEEVASETRAKVIYVRRLIVLMKKTFSMDQPMGENHDFSLGDTIEDDSAVSPDVLLDYVNKFETVSKWLETLSANEQQIINLLFGLHHSNPQTLDTIGVMFGLTRERIRQIQAKALEKLRKIAESDDLKSEKGQSAD